MKVMDCMKTSDTMKLNRFKLLRAFDRIKKHFNVSILLLIVSLALFAIPPFVGKRLFFDASHGTFVKTRVIELYGNMDGCDGRYKIMCGGFETYLRRNGTYDLRCIVDESSRKILITVIDTSTDASASQYVDVSKDKRRFRCDFKGV